MKNFLELRELIEDQIQDISYPQNPKNIYEPIKYILSLGGKRIRPALVLISHQLFNTDIERSFKAAIAIELFHNFTLLHDDIMDKSPLRRGKKTVHKKWNNDIAILSGDMMLINAYELISEINSDKLPEIMQVFNKAARKICEGQQLDLDFAKRSEITISEYLKMIEYKTSILLASSLKIGAINGGGTNQDLNNIYKFGINIGIGFQLQDDLLDIFGDSDSIGKKVGGDIESNKKTYLYLRALTDADEGQRDRLLQYFTYIRSDTKKIQDIKDIYIDLNIYDKTINLIKKYHQKAMAHLELINSENKLPLLDLCENLKCRDY